jgi:hypothetical protein
MFSNRLGVKKSNGVFLCGGNIIESNDWYQMNCVDTSILKGNFEMFFIRHLCHLYLSNQREKILLSSYVTYKPVYGKTFTIRWSAF